jgi:hypothetical protein
VSVGPLGGVKVEASVKAGIAHLVLGIVLVSETSCGTQPYHNMLEARSDYDDCLESHSQDSKVCEDEHAKLARAQEEYQKEGEDNASFLNGLIELLRR